MEFRNGLKTILSYSLFLIFNLKFFIINYYYILHDIMKVNVKLKVRFSNLIIK
jgi:hypothetical protein